MPTPQPDVVHPKRRRPTSESQLPIVDTGGIRRVADLRLRGAGGTIAVRVRWPSSAASASRPAVIVFIPDLVAAATVDEADDRLCRELCSRAGMVALCVPWGADYAGAPSSALERATLALEWSADHADELGADPGKLVVAGRGAGAAAAAALALAARDRGWPQIARQLLILAGPGSVRRPDSIDARVDPRSLARAARQTGKLAGATVVVAGERSLVERRRRCSARLRALGAEVEELLGSHTSGATGIAEPLMLELAGSLRRAFADSAETPTGDADEDRR